MEGNKEDIIRKLIEMDQNACRMVEDAQQQRRRAELELAASKTRLESDILTRAQSRIEKIKTQTTDEALRESQVIEEDGQKLLDRLEMTFEHNRLQWEDALFVRCTELLQ